MSETDFNDYYAKYCESCGQIRELSDELEDELTEPVHRVDIIEAIGPIEDVGETTAEELHDCQDCGGQIVDRWYFHPVNTIPDHDFTVDEDDVVGRDPDEDGLIAFGDETDSDSYQEVRETAGITVNNE